VTSGFYLPAGQPQGITITFNPAQLAPEFVPGNYQPVFYFYGIENGRFLSGLIPLSNAITVQSSASLAYLEESLIPTLIVQGQPVAFSARIHNSGTASIAVDQINTYFRMQVPARITYP